MKYFFLFSIFAGGAFLFYFLGFFSRGALTSYTYNKTRRYERICEALIRQDVRHQLNDIRNK